jgi:hypothetical protein
VRERAFASALLARLSLSLSLSPALVVCIPSAMVKGRKGKRGVGVALTKKGNGGRQSTTPTGTLTIAPPSK